MGESTAGPRRALFFVLPLICLALFAAGCGGGGSSTTSSTASGESEATTTTTEEESTSSGEEEAASSSETGTPVKFTEEAKAAALKDAQGKVAPPTGKLIGFMHLSESTEASVRMLENLEQAAGLFGFKVVSCDPNFEPAKMAQCMTTLVAQHPSLIVLEADATSALGGGLKTAHEEGIPVVMTGALQTPSPYLTAQYVPDEKSLTSFLDEWLFGLVKERIGNEKGVVAAFQAPTVGPGVIERDEQRAVDLKQYPNLSQITHDIDLPNAVQDTLQQTKTFVQQNSDLVALWQTCDFCAAPMAQALDELGLQGEERPLTAAYYTTKQTREEIAKEELSGGVEINFGAMAWVALDQAVEYWARKQPFAKDNEVFKNGYGIEILKPWIITKENVGENPAVVNNQGEDYVTYFETKWEKEFGVKPAAE